MNKLIKEIERTVEAKLRLADDHSKNPRSFRDGGLGGHSEYWDSNYWDDEYAAGDSYPDHDTE